MIRRLSLFFSISCFLSVYIGDVLQAQQRLTNVGRQLFFDQRLTVYDTIDAELATQTVLDMAPNNIGGTALAKDALDQATIAGIVNGGLYELTSKGSGSSTFDIKGSSYIRFDADTKGTYAPEIGADGVWDYIEASTHTGVSIYDVVTVEGSPEMTGQPGFFKFHWSASNNKLEVEQSAIEEVVGETPIGPLSRLLNGFNTQLDYDVTLDVKVDGDTVDPQPFGLPGTQFVSAPVLGDAMPVETTKDFDDEELIFSVPITVGQPFVVDALLSLNLDMSMEVIGEGQPEFEALLNFENTIDSVQFSVLDSNGNDLTGVSINSALGMDYRGASRAAAVPEPSMLAVGFTAAGVLAVRRKKNIHVP